MSANKLKVFFTSSNLVYEDPQLNVNSNTSVLDSLTEVYKERTNFKGEEFFVKIFALNVNEDYIKYKDRNKESKTYKCEISLSTSGKTFKGNLDIKKNEHSFIYNFKYNSNWTILRKEILPPKSILLPNSYQLQIYKTTVNSKQFSQQRNSLLNSLFNNSLELLQTNGNKNPNYDFDFYLELFKLIYGKNDVIKVIQVFDIRRINNPKNKDAIKKYSTILNTFENKRLEIVTKIINKEEDRNKFREYFYTLLLYFRLNFERENLDKLIQNKKIWKYLINVLQKNALYFTNINLPNDLYDEMINRTPLSFEEMESIFFYMDSLEKVLSFININIDKIYNCCLGKGKRTKKYLKLSDFNILSKESDNYTNIYKELSTLINFEKSNKYFVVLDEKLWENFVISNFLKNLNNLVIIDKCISICKEVDKSLNMNIYEHISKTALNMIIEGKLKNEELLNFLKNNIYFRDKKYASLLYRPIEMFVGIDLETANEEFYKLWNEVNMLDMYSFLENKGKKIILDKITHIKDFWKLFKLFNFSEQKIPDANTINILLSKFIPLIKTYEKETCPNFIKDISLLIYGMNKTNKNCKQFRKYYPEKIGQRNC